MAIEFSRAAENDLLEILRYGIEVHGIAQAERYKAHLEQCFQSISDNPNITRLRHEITPPVRVFPVRKHMVIYTLRDDGRTVFVLRVRHHRENWVEHPIG